MLCTPKLLIRTRSKAVNYHDAEKRQRACLMIMRHVKYPLSACLAWIPWLNKTPKYRFVSPYLVYLSLGDHSPLDQQADPFSVQSQNISREVLFSEVEEDSLGEKKKRKTRKITESPRGSRLASQDPDSH
ncbi:hypothetical protein TNCV_1943791 [Trichonephila clavipes]|nr:hypothetical protein TNCV_1943791 [Trichonephila clavipes]